jgi:flavodoxin
MKIEIVYESSTGTTAKAAQVMGEMLQKQGNQCQIDSISQADPASLLEAELIVLGGWVKGWFIIRQHPSTGVIRFVDRLADLTGKKVVVFCTYKLAAGSTLAQMAKVVEGKGADVVGQFKYRGPEPNKEFASFASSLSA